MPEGVGLFKVKSAGIGPGNVCCSVLDRHLPPRWGPGGTLFPQPAVPQNLLDHLGLLL